MRGVKFVISGIFYFGYGTLWDRNTMIRMFFLTYTLICAAYTIDLLCFKFSEVLGLKVPCQTTT